MNLEMVATNIVLDMSKRVNLTLAERDRVKNLIMERVQPLIYQPSLNFMSSTEDAKRNEEQCKQILDLLVMRGDIGATGLELNKIAISHTRRVSDLRQKGYAIQCLRQSGRIFRYRLMQ